MTTTPENIPSFGPTEAPVYNRKPFVFRYFRDEEVESQRFNLINKPLDMGTANRLMKRVGADEDEKALPEIIGIVAKHMDDKDGTPVNWDPNKSILSPKKGDPDTVRFRGPDGKIYPMEHADSFLADDKGSSRKRWLYLMNEDEGAAVTDSALKALLDYVVEIAAQRPTRASS